MQTFSPHKFTYDTPSYELCVLTHSLTISTHYLTAVLYTKITVTVRAPWAPITRACSISAVFDGPEMNTP